MRPLPIACLLAALAAPAAAQAPAGAPPTAGPPLADTAWRLERLLPPGDPAAAVVPADPTRYELRLGPDGRLAMRLDCNRGAGRWTATAEAPDQGRIAFGPLVTTRAACAPGSLEPRLAREAAQIRSYRLEGERLRLGLASGGAQLWQRAP
ncbi:META domain-containing protein [Siccirubricoccus phaeus]|uniref:META domain-containing protein n=1 Tax=Siccirubricoccus phaeus TaxID=2595053 RepID=UPI0011F2A2E0|nr:META domain-containing protein [Siccirubricoccus phaeus]